MHDADTLRSMVQQETEQIHRRISWLGTLQGFLFASLGFSWGKNNSLTFIICLLGLAIALLIFISIVAATLAMRRIRMVWLEKKPQEYKGPDIFGFFPDRAQFTQFTSPEILVPLAFAAAWVGVIAIR
jgi:hypothetical protein